MTKLLLILALLLGASSCTAYAGTYHPYGGYAVYPYGGYYYYGYGHPHYHTSACGHHGYYPRHYYHRYARPYHPHPPTRQPATLYPRRPATRR